MRTVKLLSRLLFAIFVFHPLVFVNLHAQNIGIGIQSTSRGLLIPRITEVQKSSISNPPAGLMVFVNTDNSFHYFDGSAWVKIGPEINGSRIF